MVLYLLKLNLWTDSGICQFRVRQGYGCDPPKTAEGGSRDVKEVGFWHPLHPPDLTPSWAPFRGCPELGDPVKGSHHRAPLRLSGCSPRALWEWAALCLVRWAHLGEAVRDLSLVGLFWYNSKWPFQISRDSSGYIFLCCPRIGVNKLSTKGQIVIF